VIVEHLPGCVDEYSFSCPNGSIEELGRTSAGMVLEVDLSPVIALRSITEIGAMPQFPER
jgi:hypothetical protein